jgi:hypothetical protein
MGDTSEEGVDGMESQDIDAQKGDAADDGFLPDADEAPVGSSDMAPAETSPHNSDVDACAAAAMPDAGSRLQSDPPQASQTRSSSPLLSPTYSSAQNVLSTSRPATACSPIGVPMVR